MPTTTVTQRIEGQLQALFSMASRTSPSWVGSDSVVFLDDQSGVPQVSRLELSTGDIVQLTHGRERVQSLLASAKSGRVVYGMDSGGDERQQLWSLDERTGESVRLTVVDGAMNEPGRLSADGSLLTYRNNARNAGQFDVIVRVLDGSGRAERRVFESSGQVMPLDISEDGSRILVKQLTTNLDADLWLLDVASGDVRFLNERSDEAWIYDARFNADADDVLLLTNQGSDVVRLVRLSLNTLELAPIIATEWDVEQFALAEADGSIAYTINRDGYSELWLMASGNQESVRVSALGNGVIESMGWSPDGQRLVMSWSSPTSPASLYIVDRQGSVEELLTTTHRHELRQPTVIRYPTFDERHIPAFWYEPAGEPPWPVVVDVHGGPESQRRPGFSPLTQFLLGQGYAVLAPNVRGSTGYGKTYSHLDDVERRMDAVADLHAARVWLGGVETVRGDAIVVMGQSYGGFMTLAALTEYPDDWVAGVDVVGIANFVTFLERTGVWRRVHRSAEYGDLDKHRSVLERISPIAKVDHIRVPLFVIHGRNDPRVPLHEAEQIVASLRARDQDVELLVFDDEGHGLSKRQNRVKGYGAVGQFLAHVLAT